MIERRDGRNAAQHRITGSVNFTRLAVRSDIAGINLAVVADRHLTCELIDVTGTVDLVERVFEAKAGFCRNEPGDFLTPPNQDFGRPRQYFAPFEAGQLRSEGTADTEGLGDLGGGSSCHGGNQRTIIRVANLNALIAVHQLAGDTHPLVPFHRKLRPSPPFRHRRLHTHLRPRLHRRHPFGSTPSSARTSATAARAPPLCSAVNLPMQPMRKLSATVSLPG